jgi:hypothetical protein
MFIDDFDFLIACGLGYFEDTADTFSFVFTRNIHEKLFKRQIWELVPAKPKPKPHKYF